MSIAPSLAFFAIALSAIAQGASLVRRKGPDAFSHWLLAAAGGILAVVIVARSSAISFPALTGTFESLVFYAAVLCAVCLAYRLQDAIPFSAAVQFGATMVALGLLAVASSPIAPRDLLAPIPALRSGWLVAHVALSFIGEAFFVVSFVASLAFLASKGEERKRTFDGIAYAAIAVGYPVFSIGALVFGAVWAQTAWGSWWSWDPKETWALVTWLVYSAYIHLRLFRGRRDSLPSIAAVVGFLCTVFTFFGVNNLLPGLHSYG